MLLIGAGCVLFSELAQGDEAKLRQKMEVSGVERELLRKSYGLAERWLTNNLKADGLFLYIYKPRQNMPNYKNNAIRQLMSSKLLADLASDSPMLVSQHKANIERIFDSWYRETDDGLGYIFYSRKSKLGANAMALRLLVSSPFYEDYRHQAGALAKGMMSLQDQDGAFQPWFREPAYDYDADYLLTFYSGEAILALLEYYEKEGNPQLLNAAVRAQEFYLRRYVDGIEENFYPAYVPWHTMSLAKLHEITGQLRYAEAVFVMNDRLLTLQNRTSHPGRFYNPDMPQYGRPHSSSDGIYTESLAYAYELARTLGRWEEQQRYLGAIKLAVGNLDSLQYKERHIGKGWDRGKLLGAFRVRSGDRRIRVDSVQHVMDAYRKLLSVFAEEADHGSTTPFHQQPGSACKNRSLYRTTAEALSINDSV